MKKTSFLLLFVLFNLLPGFGQNNALDFDGDGDYITLSPINGFPTGPVSDFTVEMWFISAATGTTPGNCTSGFRRLFALGVTNNSTLFEVGECNGFLSVFWFTGTAANLIQMTTSIRDNQWHCLSVVRSANNLVVYLDGNVVLTDPTVTGTHNISIFSVGHGLANAGGPTPGEDWLGRIDEVKLWNIALPAAQLTVCNPCVLTGSEPGLVAYWQFDQGVPGVNNTSITQANDATITGTNPGLFHPSTAAPDPGFVLNNGTTGNFVTSGAPLVYPKYSNLGVFISDPLLTVGLIGICDGDPVHFSLIDYNTGGVPPPASGVTVVWEFFDQGISTSWNPVPSIPPLSGFQFVVPPNDATDINCPNNSGYVDRDFRAIITVSNSLGTCTYISQPSGVRIYCKVSNASVVVAPPGPFCAGDFALLNVSLISTDPFVLPNIGSTVTVEWFLNGNPLGSGYTNLSSFPYPLGATNMCFHAEVYHCGPAFVTAQTCVQVDPKPVCGAIIGWHIPANLTFISTGIYEICPGDDAAVGIDPSSLPTFANCNPQWEYTFTPTVAASWTPLGFSNSVQNTNILPTSLWGSNTSIYYRIKCLPLSTPSGCLPCYSNIVEIRLKPALAKPVISCNPASQIICYGGPPATLSVAFDFQVTQWTWYCDGAVVGFGPSVPLDKKACYWVEATDGCYTVKSDTLCLEVCTASAIISCPIDNPCVIPGLPIKLGGGLCTSTCGGPYTYTWGWNNGTYISGQGTDMLCHIPDLSGTFYTLTVVDANGCTHSTTVFIKPCQP